MSLMYASQSVLRLKSTTHLVQVAIESCVYRVFPGRALSSLGV